MEVGKDDEFRTKSTDKRRNKGNFFLIFNAALHYNYLDEGEKRVSEK